MKFCPNREILSLAVCHNTGAAAFKKYASEKVKTFLFSGKSINGTT